MPRYLMRRVGQAALVLWAAYTVSFLVLYALPGDAVDTRFGGDASDITPEQLQALREQYGLDQALPLQYLSRLGRALTGDFGTSFDNGRPVSALIAESLPATAAVAGLALVLGILGGTGLALLAAGAPDRWYSRLPLNLPPLGVAVPSFLFGLLLLELFSFRRTGSRPSATRGSAASCCPPSRWPSRPAPWSPSCWPRACTRR